LQKSNRFLVEKVKIAHYIYAKYTIRIRIIWQPHPMQQLLPGEKQDSANIALGQTYEQMDKNEEGRFGPRGAEKVEQVLLKPTS
jgi:hypothetical protein